MALDKQVSLKLEKELFAKIEDEAKKERRSINLTITMILEKFFAKKKEK